MDTVFAETLLAVIETGSIAGAARRMAITPGAVALRIKRLEADIGTVLLQRTGRMVVPTGAASRLAESLGDIVARTADLRYLATEHSIVAGELRIGTIATASTGVLPMLLVSLLRSNPGLDIVVVPGTSAELCDMVLAGTIDAAIVVEPPLAPRKGETFEIWIEEPLVLIVPPGTTVVDPLALVARELFIRYDRRNWGGRIVDHWLKLNGLRVHDRIELDALDGIVAMVSAGLGVAVIPDWVGPRPTGSAVMTIGLPDAPVRRVGLYYRRLSPRQELIALLTPALRVSRSAAEG
ncbi:LysR family transcriptional regulator [Sphingomonas mali]|uniref:LysR family transcriptional regulator n=1 Tax=Sphingomonas mali TaxID=40682 RepID=UPI0008297F39|nr:LysR family transcriptional regulator [Sphingomonas mali]